MEKLEQSFQKALQAVRKSRGNQGGYYTVVLPYQATGGSRWHPTSASGPFSVLTRGSFRTKKEAIAWARANAKTGYKIKHVKEAKGTYGSKRMTTKATEFTANGHTFRWSILGEARGSLLCLDPVIDDGIDLTTWPKDEEVSARVGATVRFLDGGDHPKYPEGIFEIVRKLPSQSQYESSEIRKAQQRLQEIEKAPLAERKEAQSEWFQAISESPKRVAERLEWLLDGNYGFGEMQQAKNIVQNPRMNREAALAQLIAAYEWMTPGRMAVDAWKKLNSAQKTALSKQIEKVIKEYEHQKD